MAYFGQYRLLVTYRLVWIARTEVLHHFKALDRVAEHKVGQPQDHDGTIWCAEPPSARIGSIVMSNRVVTYVDINLNSVEDYWNQLIVPDVEAFRRAPSPRSVFQAAHSVWHLHDWVWHDRNPGMNSRGAVFDTYRSQLFADCPELSWLRDVPTLASIADWAACQKLKALSLKRLVRVPFCCSGSVELATL
jgi:hypothetical protein